MESNQQMGNNDFIPKWLFPAISWILSGYFFLVFHKICGFPLKVPTDKWSWVFLGLGVLFFLAPFTKKIKIGKYIEFEREIKDVKDNISDFKSETRQSLSVISASINAISSVQNVNVYNVPGIEEMRAAVKKSKLTWIAGAPIPGALEEERELRLEDEDNIMVLARLRIQLEQLLRQILGKKLGTKKFHGVEVKFLSARNLSRIFINKYPNHKSMLEAFDYVIRICNAAIHGQRIPEDVASEALYAGSRIVAVLNQIAEEG